MPTWEVAGASQCNVQEEGAAATSADEHAHRRQQHSETERTRILAATHFFGLFPVNLKLRACARLKTEILEGHLDDAMRIFTHIPCSSYADTRVLLRNRHPTCAHRDHRELDGSEKRVAAKRPMPRQPGRFTHRM